MKKFKRILALVLAIMTVVSTMSVGVIAADNQDSDCPAKHTTKADCDKVGVVCTLIGSGEDESVEEGYCTKASYAIYKCACGKIFTEITPAKPHTVGEIVTDEKPATCTEDGFITGKCDNCGFTVTEKIPATGHAYEEVLVKDATATTEGLVEFRCACGDVLPLEIATTCEHVYDTIILIAGCENDGYHKVICEKCGTVAVNETTPATGHTFTEADWEIDTVTCTGVRERAYCDNCGWNYREINEGGEHNWGSAAVSVEVEAVLELMGYSASKGWNLIGDEYACEGKVAIYRYCRDCGAVETQKVDTAGHYYVKDYASAEAGKSFCEVGGVMTEYCYFCSYTEIDGKKHFATVKSTETYEAGTHIAEATIERTEPDCENDGSIVMTWDCCGATVTITAEEDESLKATGHSYTKLDKIAATCKEYAKSTYVCEYCGAADPDAEVTIYEEEGYGDHDWAEIRIEPTCTETGLTVKFCQLCDAADNESDASEVILPATGHNMVADPENSVAATCEAGGVEAKICANGCGHAETEPIPALDHTRAEVPSRTEMSCVVPYTEYYDCAICGAKEAFTLVANGKYGNHTGNNYSTDFGYRAPTCGMDGRGIGTCEVCEKENVYIVIPATGEHDYQTVGENKDATCVDNGSTAGSVCSVCGDVEVAETVIPATGAHTYIAITEETVATNDKVAALVAKYAALGIDLMPITEATCTTYARTYEMCDVCGELTITNFKPALSPEKTHVYITDPTAENFKYVEDKSTAPTCTEDGEYVIPCQYCGTVSADTVVWEAKGHHNEEQGYYFNCEATDDNWKCDVCDYDHVIGTAKVEATCINYACTVEFCTSCGKTINVVYGETEDKIPHSYGELEVVKEATCDEEGRKAKVCTGCGDEIDVEVIPATGHTVEEWNIVTDVDDANYGKSVGTCTVCGEVVEREAENYDLEFNYYINHAIETEDGYVADDYNVVNSGIIEVTIKTNAKENDIDLYSILLKLGYDTEVLEYLGFEEELCGAFGEYKAAANKNGVVTITASVLSQKEVVIDHKAPYNISLTGESDFAKLYFRVAEGVDVDATDVELYFQTNSTIIKIDNTAEGGVAVVEDSQNISFGEKNSEGLVASADIKLLGNLVGNTSTVDYADAIAWLVLVSTQNEETLEWDMYKSEADMDQNGVLNLVDYARIMAIVNA